tara:strand:+ start:316 stop:738 length:423 start_codon:yes stop_codon:yes gene_type:complete
MAANVFSGCRARFKIDGVPVGFAAGVSGSESIDYEPVDVLNLLEVKEFVPVAYRATLSAQVFRVIGSSLKRLGIFPQQQNILTTGELDCSIEDRLTGTTMAHLQGCKAQEHTFDVTARGIVSENVTFVTIRMKDEFDLGL